LEILIRMLLGNYWKVKMSNETQKHLNLKKQAIQILKNKGFTDKEIHCEFRWERYIIDVVAINKQKKVFIECGIINRKKFEDLKIKEEIEFIHLPYLKKSITEIPKIKKTIKNGIISLILLWLCFYLQFVLYLPKFRH